ncbi:warA [Symbiodinium natans]|uniref:WarA protein n=1 Tax=Symbiodinium natans TaxID=878477 RepID=A0A812I5B3_9DINO|nr:warA [Symbiodinium natans]
MAVPWGPPGQRQVERMVSMPAQRHAAAAAPPVVMSSAAAMRLRAAAGQGTPQPPSSPTRQHVLVQQRPLPTHHHYPSQQPTAPSGAARLSPRQGGFRGPAVQRTSIPNAQWRPQPVHSGSVGAWPRSLSAENRAGTNQGTSTASKVPRPSHREASPGEPGPCYSSRSVRGDDPLSRTFTSGEISEGVQVVCAPRENLSPRMRAKAAPAPQNAGAPAVQRCASASLARPQRQSPQRQSSAGRPFSARPSASPTRKSPSPEPRCIAPESPRNNTRVEGRRPREGHAGVLGLERGTEHLLLERIAALEAQVIDRHDLLQKISKQQEQLDRLENLARENAKLKAQVAKGPARRVAPAANAGGPRRVAPRAEPTVTRRMAPAPQVSEALLPTMAPRRYGHSPPAEAQKVRSKPASIPVRSNSQDVLWQPLSPREKVLKFQASMSMGQLIPEKKAQELDLRLGELEAALGLPADGSEATTTGPRMDELDGSHEDEDAEPELR